MIKKIEIDINKSFDLHGLEISKNKVTMKYWSLKYWYAVNDLIWYLLAEPASYPSAQIETSYY